MIAELRFYRPTPYVRDINALDEKSGIESRQGSDRYIGMVLEAVFRAAQNRSSRGFSFHRAVGKTAV